MALRTTRGCLELISKPVGDACREWRSPGRAQDFVGFGRDSSSSGLCGSESRALAQAKVGSEFEVEVDLHTSPKPPNTMLPTRTSPNPTMVTKAQQGLNLPAAAKGSSCAGARDSKARSHTA